MLSIILFGKLFKFVQRMSQVNDYFSLFFFFGHLCSLKLTTNLDIIGELKIWVNIQGAIYDMIIKVPRIFYIYAEDWNAVEKLKFGKVVKKRIPRGGRREVEVIEVS